MKKILKNKAILISFLILLTITFIGSAKYYINYKKIDNNIKLMKKECINENNKDIKCEQILKLENEYKKFDTYTTFYSLITDKPIDILFILGPLFIIIPSIWYISKEMKSSYIKYYSIRKGYKNYLKHLFKNAYKSIFIIPIVMLILFLIAGFISHWNFDYTYALTHSYSTYDEQYLINFIPFFIIFIINLILFSIFYANLGLLFINKNKSTLVSIIESYLTFLSIEIINEVLITGVLFYKILHIPIQSILNIYDIYSYKGVYGYFPFLLVGLIYAFLSFIVVFIKYKNKEKTIINCEIIS